MWPLILLKVVTHLKFSLGFFGEVFRGLWNGTDVAIKVFLEQDLTTENMKDFCNEISILRFYLYLLAHYFSYELSKRLFSYFFFSFCCSRLRHPNGTTSTLSFHWFSFNFLILVSTFVSICWVLCSEMAFPISSRKELMIYFEKYANHVYGALDCSHTLSWCMYEASSLIPSH